MSVCLLFLTLIRISMKISKDPPKILITDTVNKSKYTNKSQYSLNIEDVFVISLWMTWIQELSFTL